MEIEESRDSKKASLLGGAQKPYTFNEKTKSGTRSLGQTVLGGREVKGGHR